MYFTNSRQPPEPIPVTSRATHGRAAIITDRHLRNLVGLVGDIRIFADGYSSQSTVLAFPRIGSAGDDPGALP